LLAGTKSNRSIFASGRDWLYWRARNLFLKLRHLQPDALYVKRRFKERFGYEPDLRSPKTLNEKIQWLKLYDRRPIHRVCADKLAVRGHVADRIGERYVVELLTVLSSADDLTPEKLPAAPFVIKGNLDSGSTVIVFDKAAVDWPAVRAQFRRSLRQNYYWREREWQYGGSKRRILIEKALVDEQGNPAVDFKLHCLNGKAAFVQVDQDRFAGHKRVLYDLDWNVIEGEWSHPMGRRIDRPAQLPELINLAERLACDFDYARIDFYLFEDRIYFGEITFHPQAGLGPFRPASLDLAFGERIVLTGLKPSTASARSAAS